METKEQKQALQIALNSYYGYQGSNGRIYPQQDYQKLYQEMISEEISISYIDFFTKEEIIEKRNQKINQILDDEWTTI